MLEYMRTYVQSVILGELIGTPKLINVGTEYLGNGCHYPKHQPRFNQGGGIFGNPRKILS